MPWVDEGSCTGCGVCIDNCPVGAIVPEDEKAKIDMRECIRCGVCHEVCAQDAVRHDSEKLPERIKANVEMTNKFMHACAYYLGDSKEKMTCLGRMIKHFNREKTIAEKTIQELEKLRH